MIAVSGVDAVVIFLLYRHSLVTSILYCTRAHIIIAAVEEDAVAVSWTPLAAGSEGGYRDKVAKRGSRLERLR